MAIASGRVYQLACPNGWFLGIDHGDGWKSEYYHLSNPRGELIGTWVSVGTYLGEAGNTLPCGGSSNGPHVHLSILYGTVPQPGPGVLRPYYPVSGMQFGNYTITAGATAFSGTWRTLAGATVITNWGCCLTSSTTV
ncbi:MAG TPA: M23 family metallopeptidase, partial [Microbacterium sp.]|nr:M23 family metallopeptidase [Microbacterium sp.]